MTVPSREFLVRQACLNALDLEKTEFRFHGTVQEYARFRFSELPRWPFGFTTMVRTEFRKLVDQFQ